MKKLIKLDFDNTTRERKTEDSYSELYSYDKNNGSFEFEILNDTLTTEQVIALFKFTESNKIWKTTGTVEGNKVKLTFDTSLITQNETVICYLYFDEEQRTSDTFRFKFKVKVSEIDKMSRYEVKERFINNTVIIDRLDVVTKTELQEALKNVGGIATEGLLTEVKAEEIYAKKSEAVDNTNFELVKNRVLALELKTDNDTVYDDTPLKERVTALESKIIEGGAYDDSDLRNRVVALETKEDKDTKYDDTEVKRRLTELENKPAVDTSVFVTEEKLSEKGYLTQHQDLTPYALKSELPTPYNDSALVSRINVLEAKTDNDTVYNDTEVKERLTALESKPTVDTSNLVTKDELNTLKPNQTLSLNNGTLSISGGNSVALPVSRYEIHGSGMPNGVVEAEIGTTYVDKNKTNGAFKWIKTTDGGNQGWEVLTGDTGWRTLNSVSKLGNSFVKIRRVNNLVTYNFGGLQWGWFGIIRRGGAGYNAQPTDLERNCFVLNHNQVPEGFRTPNSLIGSIYDDNGVPYGTWYIGNPADANHLRFQFLNPVPTDRDIGDIRVSTISYFTDEPWPQQLP